MVGGAAGSLVLLPRIGLEPMLAGGALLDMELGALVLVAALPRRRALAYGAAVAGLLIAGLVTVKGGFSPLLLVSGVYRTGAIPQPGSHDVLFYRDGRTATVSVLRDTQSGDIAIATNGKPDASLEPDWFRRCDEVGRRKPITADSSTQTLAPLIALAHAPHARLGAGIGQGARVSAPVPLASPTLEKLVP